jgi:hypothetical protein
MLQQTINTMNKTNIHLAALLRGWNFSAGMRAGAVAAAAPPPTWTLWGWQQLRQNWESSGRSTPHIEQNIALPNASVLGRAITGQRYCSNIHLGKEIPFVSNIAQNDTSPECTNR